MQRASFEPIPESARAAREFVRSCLPGGFAADVDVVLLLTSELATNAITHTRLTFDVMVELIDGGVRVAVHDLRSILPAPLERLDRADDGDGSRGLAVVAALADAWGIEPTHQGKQSWFQVCP